MAGDTAHSETALSSGQPRDCCSAFGNVISAWHLQMCQALWLPETLKIWRRRQSHQGPGLAGRGIHPGRNQARRHARLCYSSMQRHARQQ